jgi:SAM-dependent methyltransferase
VSWFRKTSPSAGGHFGGDAVVDEHFVPNRGLELEEYAKNGDLTGAHHLVRYLWAVEHLREAPPARVLDLGCGSGYGSFTLAGALPDAEVVGVDYDEDAITQAQRAYARPNLRYAQGNPLRWEDDIGVETWDVIVCFDVLEHVDHREIFMESLARHLAGGGQLLLSTPCGRATNELKPGWEHHKIEYSAASLFDFLRRYFREIVGSDNDAFPHREVFVRLHEMGIDYVLFLNPVICREPIVVSNPYAHS